MPIVQPWSDGRGPVAARGALRSEDKAAIASTQASATARPEISLVDRIRIPFIIGRRMRPP